MGPEANRTPHSPWVKFSVAIAAAGAICVLAFLFAWGGRENPVDVQAAQSMELKSTSFPGGSIPAQYTCDGAEVSPSFDWSGAPAGTKSFAIIMHDPDAPRDYTHWVAYDIPANVHGLAGGAATSDTMPSGSVEGRNGSHEMGYQGPCPPAGNPHHYVFQLYALNTNLELPAGATREQVQSAMQSHILATGKLVATYKRSE